MNISNTFFFILALLVAFSVSACQTAMEPVVTTPYAEVNLTENGLNLTADELKNAEYVIVENEQPYLVRLTDGKYQFGDNPFADDYVFIGVADVFTFGDLNHDHLDDAVVILIEEYGGINYLVSLAAVLNENGQPKHVSTAYLDRKPVIFSLKIEDGEIFTQLLVHAPEDELCCPTIAQTRTYRLGPRGLVLTQLDSQIKEGPAYRILIDTPQPFSALGVQIVLKGTIKAAPPESKLVLKIFDSNEKQVYIAPLELQKSAEEEALFQTTIDLSSMDFSGETIRLEVSYTSLESGMLLALSSVDLARR